MYRSKTIKPIVKVFLFFLMCLRLNAAFNQELYNETMMIFKGFYLQDESPDLSVLVFEKLYDDTNESEYLKESIKIAFNHNDKNFARLVEKGKYTLSDSPEYIRIRIAYDLDINNLKEALFLSEKLIKIEKSAHNYMVLGAVQNLSNLNEEALLSFKEAFRLEPNDKNIIRVANLLINSLNRVDEAIKELETYKTIYGCSVDVCSYLAQIYGSKKDISNIIKTYEELYKSTKDSSYIKDLIGFYMYFGDFNKTKDLLEKTSYDDKMLLEIYIHEKNYGKAIEKAKDAYKKTNDSEFLALAAVIEYEKNLGNLTDDILKEIIKKFEKSIKNLNNDVYENYYGYLLIDNEIDVPKGINLVEKALSQDPYSPYYLDSLAWGYYKLGNCEKADSILRTIDIKDVDYFESDEAKKHIEAIKECLKNMINESKNSK